MASTNRNSFSENGEKHEEADYYRIVAFGKLAELRHEYLKKGRKVYCEGRLQSRSYTDNEGIEKATTEIVLDDFVLLDSKPQDTAPEVSNHQREQQGATTS